MPKKILSIVLILTLVLSSGAFAFAFAADEGLWESEGPMHLWTEAQWAAAQDWNRDQMYYYYKGYTDAMDAMGWDEEWDAFTNEETAAQNNWTDAQWDLYDQLSSAYWELNDIYSLIDEKEKLGFPYTEGINVSVNGEYLSFEDARPALIDGRTMVPFRAILEALGAEVAYDSASRSATATGESGDVMVLTLDSNLIAITRADGSEEELVMDTVPYLDSAQGRIFVPARFVSEALGCDVFWNEYYELVSIVDKDALIEEIDQRFTLCNRLLQSSLAQMEEPISTTQTTSLTGVLYGDTKDTNISVGAHSTLQMDGSKLAGSIDVRFDIKQLMALFGEEFFTETLGLELPEWVKKGGNINFIYNGETGEAFVNSLLLNPGKDTWVRYAADQAEAAEVNEALAMLENKEAFTVGNLLYETAAAGFDSSYNDSSEELDLAASLRSSAALAELFLGDSAFKSSTNGTVSTHSMTITNATLLSNALVQDLGMDLIDLFSTFASGDFTLPEFKLSMVIREDGGKLLDMDIQGDMKLTGFFPADISLSAKGDGSKGTCTIEFIGAYLGKLLLESTSATAPADKTVPTAPPAGAEVEDYVDPWAEYYEE